MSRPFGSRTASALSRRRFLQLATLAASGALLGCRSNEDAAPEPTETAPPTRVTITTVPGYDDPTVWQDRSVVVASWGGEYQRAQEEAIFEPFQLLTGARIETTNTDLRALREQVEAGEPTWDLCDILTDDVLPLANLGLLEELDYNVVDPDGIIGETRMDHGVGSSFYSTVLAYRADRWPGLPAPEGWSTFWDLERYPGSRGLHRQAQGTLEFALLADGVALEDLYPLELDRAFAALERVRHALTLWWEQGAQPAQILSSGDVDMVSAWHSRIDRLREQGATVAISWQGGAIAGDSWVIPRGSENRDVAMDLINFATRPEVSAAFSSRVPFGPANERAFELLSPDVIARLPNGPEQRAVQFVTDHEWWFKHREDVDARFEAWMTEHP